MNIVVASFTYSPNIDGVAIAAKLMVTNLVVAGHKVRVATGHLDGIPNEEKIDGHSIRRFSVLDNGKVNDDEQDSYINFLKDPKNDLIIFHSWQSWPTDSALKRIGEIKVRKIMVSHGYATHIFNKHPVFPWGIYSWLKRIPRVLALPRDLKAFDLVVFLSNKRDFGRFFDAWLAKAIGHRKIRVIPNSINGDFKPFHINFRDKWGLGDCIIFLCVANYNICKNQEMALRAFCRANIPGSSMIFAGSQLGEYGKKIQEHWFSVEQKYPELKVHFLEGLSREEIVSAFTACDIFVLSSKTEAQPIVLLEAMACGKPFISTDTGCISELKGGIVVKNTDAMAKQMRYLAAQPTVRTELGDQGKTYFDQFCSPDATRRAWLDLIEEVVNRTGNVRNS